MRADGVVSSQYNFVRAGEPIPDRAPMLVDVTLRDGEQTVDVAFTAGEKLDFLRALERAGVGRAQVGFASDPHDVAVVREARIQGLQIELELLVFVLRDGWEAHIDAAKQAGAEVIQILVRGSDDLLDSMSISRSQLLERLAEGVRQAREAGFTTIAAGPSFTTSTDADFLREIYRTALDAGADELVINDSTGIARPSAISHIVEIVRSLAPRVVRVHCHNDFGLAVANSLAAWEAGASVIDVAVLGLGERAGNVPLEEIAMALDQLYARPTPVHLERLTSLCHWTADTLQLILAPNKVIVGKNAFAQKLEQHVAITRRRPELFEPYPPDRVGGTRVLALGKGSGPIAVMTKLAELGRQVDSPSVLRELAVWANSFADAQKRAVTDQELLVRLDALMGVQ